MIRSHVGGILFVCGRPPHYDEFATMGRDGTIRIWDTLSGQQKFEFESSIDTPLVGAFHPTLHTLSVGFQSGMLRVFDVETTTTLFERNQRVVPMSTILYSPNGDRLYCSALDGHLCIYSVHSGYILLKTVAVNPIPGEHILLSMNTLGTLLAVTGSSLMSLTVFDLSDFKIALRSYVGENNAVVTNSRGLSSTQPRTIDKQEYASGTNNFPLPLGVSAIIPTTVPDNSSAGMRMTRGSSTTASFGGTQNSASSSIFPSSSLQDEKIHGIAFCEDQYGNQALIVLSDKHLFCTSIVIVTVYGDDYVQSGGNEFEDYTSKLPRLEVSWGKKCSRKIEFSNPLSLFRDPTTGLLFVPFFDVPVTSNEKKKRKDMNSNGYNIQNGVSPSLAVFSAKLKPIRTKEQTLSHILSLSSTQVYRHLPSFITSVCPCTPTQRVVSVDDQGSIAIWHFRVDKTKDMLSESMKMETDLDKLSLWNSTDISPDSANASSSAGATALTRGGLLTKLTSENDFRGNRMPSSEYHSNEMTYESMNMHHDQLLNDDEMDTLEPRPPFQSAQDPNLTEIRRMRERKGGAENVVKSSFVNLSKEFENTLTSLENWDILPSYSQRRGDRDLSQVRESSVKDAMPPSNSKLNTMIDTMNSSRPPRRSQDDSVLPDPYSRSLASKSHEDDVHHRPGLVDGSHYKASNQNFGNLDFDIPPYLRKGDVEARPKPAADALYSTHQVVVSYEGEEPPKEEGQSARAMDRDDNVGGSGGEDGGEEEEEEDDDVDLFKVPPRIKDTSAYHAVTIEDAPTESPGEDKSRINDIRLSFLERQKQISSTPQGTGTFSNLWDDSKHMEMKASERIAAGLQAWAAMNDQAQFDVEDTGYKVTKVEVPSFSRERSVFGSHDANAPAQPEAGSIPEPTRQSHSQLQLEVDVISQQLPGTVAE